MRGWRALAIAALAAHVLGWWLPVVRDYRGWQAFRVALTPLWPYENFRIEQGWLLVLSVASGLTNLVFVVLLGVLIARQRERFVGVAALGAALLDLHWPISMGAQRSELASGYFVWLASFLLLGLAAFAKGRSRLR